MKEKFVKNVRLSVDTHRKYKAEAATRGLSMEEYVNHILIAALGSKVVTDGR